ncbi:MAG: hypothetical protein QNJ85_18470 [Gammaproteobacteria bacterium]|nr:hypothetical protein [Gammaproteobacteria bacterium]
MNRPEDEPWLVRPRSIRLLWRIFWAVLALTVLLQVVIKVKGYFIVDGWFGFGAAFGFLSCVAMVLGARVLGYMLKRDDTYYQAGEGGDD